MRIDVISVFPELLLPLIESSIIKKAREQEKVDIHLVDLRTFSHSKHKTIDDTPYGGGAGMLLQFPPVYDAIMCYKRPETKVIMLSPQGVLYTQSYAQSLSTYPHLILLCGRYEGFDERIYSLVDMEISIGDYILMGGEIAAMVLIESITRLLPGVIENESVATDSLNNNLLKYPEYTKPREYQGLRVPEVLLSGDHQAINKWRAEQALQRTLAKRPDLLHKGEKNEQRNTTTKIKR